MGMYVPTTADFLKIAQWSGIFTLVCGAIAILGFLFKWGIRFRFVGVTGFMAVLTVGLFSLSLFPLTRTIIPGAVRYTSVYDSGSTNVVITVPTPLTEEAFTATLQQAASDMFSPGRLGRGGEDRLTIRARTVIHPSEGVSEPLYLGEVRRSLLNRDDEDMTIRINRANFAKLPQPVAEEAAAS
ncbi:Ycf51 family protein [Leptolyngbya sp. AN02str]|uniref:Ycf51 family protein n=1 Tax=Leptolyngbya sp. AN02str TaxID=3423363 RepID=UPI003D3178DC